MATRARRFQAPSASWTNSAIVRPLRAALGFGAEPLTVPRSDRHPAANVSKAMHFRASCRSKYRLHSFDRHR